MSNESLPHLPSSTSDEQPRPAPRLEIGSLAAIAVLLIVDLFADAASTSVLHVTVELAATALAVVTAVRLWRRWLLARRALEGSVDDLSGRLRVATADASRWRMEAREALRGLGAAIERQCNRWQLTEAERAVAVLLLLGDRHTPFTIAQLLLPFGAVYRPFAVGLGQLAVYGMTLVAGTFYVRRHIGRRGWRLIHFGSFAVFGLALLHGLGASSDRTVMVAGVVPTLLILFFGIYRTLAHLASAAAAEVRAQ